MRASTWKSTRPCLVSAGGATLEMLLFFYQVAGSEERIAMLLSFLAGLFSYDLAIDLGTANPLVYVRGEVIFMNEPSFVAIHLADHSVLAVGHEDKAMLRRTHGEITAIRPIKHCVFDDMATTEK